MFTGLVQNTGRVRAVTPSGNENRLRIQPSSPFTDCARGESIAVNGVCLTVEKAAPGEFTAYASAETLLRSNLKGIRPGDEVNLERALRLGDRLGGHLVSGHVDALCEIAGMDKAGLSLRCRLSCPLEQARYICAKGSVCLDGISLTVNTCGPDYFEVNIIPATQACTTIRSWKTGRKINLETDLIAKYLERLVMPQGGGAGLARTGGGFSLHEM
ncbi:MAG: riboflavin synthase [Deltaproteobacteria bacterium]|jgi:riboflavin synthase|nr:riboflavin synthase [Deltaproteobacteria bacterium]